ncbi:hypothetical protein [Acinetobacter rathckeae]|uniref:hypothetical protein n=1 Tax=Acinetobacter rathckeae TaxID=2605272 RepID=UPI0018A25B62|nr:hypothetical protein [Acinetobacter rathckeae]MBF7696605.1 hypothetical protein [Acinetobacter rathckeae]
MAGMTASERKAKQRRELREKGFLAKEVWLHKDVIASLERLKTHKNLKSIDETIAYLAKEKL